MDARVSRGLFAIGIVGASLAIGTLHTGVLFVVALAFAASAFFGWRAEAPFRVRSVATALVVLSLGLLLYTALQAMPLPTGLVSILSPYAGDVWRRTLWPLGAAGPAWCSLSLDPIASRIEVLRGATYFCCLVAALPMVRHRGGVDFVESVLLASTVLMGVAAIVHPALGLNEVFGIYKPMNDYAARHVAPLLNANHLAGYLNIGVCISLGALLSPRPHASRVALFLVALFLIVVEVWVASRGGTATMILGLVLITAASVRLRSESRATTALSALMVVPFVLACVAMFVVVGSEAAWTELASSDISKLAIFGQAMHIVLRAPFFGIGRGAFQSVFPAFRSDVGDYTFTHPENIVAQLLVEWGVVVAVLAFVVMAIALRPNSALARSRPPVGAWAALACSFVHNLVDFNNEVPGVMVALVTCAALVVGGSAGHRERFRFQRWPRRPRAVAWAALGVTACAALVASPALGHDLDSDEGRIQARLVSSPRDRVGFDGELAADMLRHPAEPYFPYMGGLRAWSQHDESPIAWLAASLERSTSYGRAHLVLARTLFSRAPAQARLEYRLAYIQAPYLIDVVARESAPLVSNADDARELAPGVTASELAMARLLSDAVRARLPSTAATLDTELAASNDVVALQHRAEAAVVDLEEPGSSWCDERRDDCIDAAASAVARLRNAAPNSCHTDSIDAQLLLAEAKENDALTTLERAVRSDRDGLECVESLVALAARGTKDERSDALLDRLASNACSAGVACVETLDALSRAEEQRGHPRRALTFAKRAYERDSNDGHLLHLAQLAAAAGLHAEALEDYRRIAQRHPGNAEWKPVIDAERNAAFRELTPPL